MLSRFFHVRSALKPFAATSARPTVEPGDPCARNDAAYRHLDYDRHPLQTRGFDHYVEWNEDDERFLVH